MTAAPAREAFGAEFVGADGFLNSPTDRGLQVAAGATGHGVDVVERQGQPNHDTPRCKLVCG
jgi:hypothetical protein